MRFRCVGEKNISNASEMHLKCISESVGTVVSEMRFQCIWKPPRRVCNSRTLLKLAPRLNFVFGMATPSPIRLPTHILHCCWCCPCFGRLPSRWPTRDDRRAEVLLLAPEVWRAKKKRWARCLGPHGTGGAVQAAQFIHIHINIYIKIVFKTHFRRYMPDGI